MQDIIIQGKIVIGIIMVRTDRIKIPDIVKGIINLHHKGTVLQLKDYLLLKLSRTGITPGIEVSKGSIQVLEGREIG